MKAWVIRLKQDALRLFNLTIAGCACGALVNLFKLAYGYPESKEQKTRAKEFEKLERQLSDHDEEITILEPEQDKLKQAEQLKHPFQQAPPVVAGTSKDIHAQAKSGEYSKKLAMRVVPEHVSVDVHRKQMAKKSHTTWMMYPDVKKLKDATSLYLTTSIKLCWTGMTPEMFHTDYIRQTSSKSGGNTKVSRYSCHLYVPNTTDQMCNYSTSNSGQMGTPVHYCLLSICSECKACGIK